jgi:addiction module HigA family antidote
MRTKSKSPTITDIESTTTDAVAEPPVHPGEILRDEYLAPLGMSQNALARALAVPPRRVNEIALGKRALTADSALRLARYFGTTPEYWMNMQAHYELEIARDRLGDRLEREVTARD